MRTTRVGSTEAFSYTCKVQEGCSFVKEDAVDSSNAKNTSKETGLFRGHLREREEPCVAPLFTADLLWEISGDSFLTKYHGGNRRP